MNWEAVGAVGEIVGALAVIATLGYVAAQIRQNTHSVTTAVYESAMAGFNEHIRFVASDAELSSILRRGSIAPASLEDEELFRFTFIIRHYVNHVYKLFRLYEQGVFPKGEWRNVAGEAVQLFSMPGLAEFKDKNQYWDSESSKTATGSFNSGPTKRPPMVEPKLGPERPGSRRVG